MKSLNETRANHFTVLSKACLQNLSLDVRILGEEKTETHRSRFLGLMEDSEPDALIIEAPTSKGNIILMRPGQEVKIVFIYEGIIHSFTTVIIGRTRYQLNSEMAVSSLKLRLPEAMSVGKIRSFYRLALPGAGRIEVSMGVYAQQRAKSRRVRSREKAILTDIGGGGLGFRISEGRSLLMNVDTRLFLTFHLPNEEEPIRLLGRVCFYLRRRELREVFFGVQFIETDSDIQYKRNIDKILHYVAEQQRLNLSRRVNAVR